MFPESEEFLAVLQSLGEIREQEQRLVALLASNQDDEQLLALRAVFEQLVLDACSLVRFNADLHSTSLCIHVTVEAELCYLTSNLSIPQVTAKLGIPCTYDVLLKLKTEADAFNKTQNAIDRLVAFLPVNGISASSWIQANNIHCEVSAESFEIINTAHSGVLNRNDCM